MCLFNISTFISFSTKNKLYYFNNHRGITQHVLYVERYITLKLKSLVTEVFWEDVFLFWQITNNDTFKNKVKGTT